MDLIDIVRQAQGGNAIANMARTFNLSPQQAEAAIKAVLPELARGIERNTLNRGGVADLIEMLGDNRHGTNLQNPDMFGNRQVQAQGNDLLGAILGTKDASRAAAQRASLSSGLGEGMIKMLLPYIAQMLMGALAGKTQGGLGDILSKIPGLPGAPSGQGNISGNRGGLSFPQTRNTPQQPVPPSGSGGGFGNNPFGGGQNSTGGFGNQAPLPLPTGLPPEGSSNGGTNPYGDLSDIIRGGRAPAPMGGGSLTNVIRDMLGGALGYSTKGGVMGWIFRAIVMRYGWSILRSVLGGVLGRR
jgi:hypothetical protein